MNLFLLPHGRPGQHLGVSHTVKHWLHPAELWDDLADGCPDSVRPRAVRAAYPSLDPLTWDPEHPPPEVARRWSELGRVYAEGYGRVLLRLAELLSPPPAAPGAWVRQGRLRSTVEAHTGVILRVRKAAAGWDLHSAFRTKVYQFAHIDPPRAPDHVSLRRRLFAHRAHSRLAYWRRQENP